MPPHVSKLWIHPVKSCRAIEVASIALDARGVAGDRRFLVTDLEGRMLTQRSHPALARIVTALTDTHLMLSTETDGSIAVPQQSVGAPLVTTEVWGSGPLQAEDCGAPAREWLTQVLQLPAQLLRIGRDFRRNVSGSADDEVSFADAYPLLAIGEASLAGLNERLAARGESPVPMDRFRPNVVIAGSEPHAEDHWTRVRVGSAVLRGATLCARCIMPTTDQTTGERRGPEPLRTLATYRRDPARPQEVNFGRNLVNASKEGVIRLGDRIDVLD